MPVDFFGDERAIAHFVYGSAEHREIFVQVVIVVRDLPPTVCLAHIVGEVSQGGDLGEEMRIFPVRVKDQDSR